MKENFIVTGGAGFIGSNLIDRLMEEDIDNLTVIDNMRTGRYEFIQQHCNNRKFNFIKADIKKINPQDLPQFHYDAIYHLAANADIRCGIKNTIVDLDENVIGTHNVLEIMRKMDIKNLIFASTSAVYGEANVIPTPESLSNIKPISFYAASKLAAESFISSYCYTYGMKAWVFRFANVIGKRCSHGVIPDFVNKLKKNPNKLEILGDGNQEKSFFDISDCVNGLMKIPKLDRKIVVEAYNLGNKDTIRIKDLAKIVVNRMGLSNVKFTYTGGDRGWVGDVPKTILSINKALKLGWKPKYSVKESIERTVDYLFKEKK